MTSEVEDAARAYYDAFNDYAAKVQALKDEGRGEEISQFLADTANTDPVHGARRRLFERVEAQHGL